MLDLLCRYHCAKMTQQSTKMELLEILLSYASCDEWSCAKPQMRAHWSAESASGSAAHTVSKEHARLGQCDAARETLHERLEGVLTLPSHIVPNDVQEPEAGKEGEEETKTEATNGKEEAPKEAPKGLPALAPRKKKAAAAADAAKQVEA